MIFCFLLKSRSKIRNSAGRGVSSVRGGRGEGMTPKKLTLQARTGYSGSSRVRLGNNGGGFIRRSGRGKPSSSESRAPIGLVTVLSPLSRRREDRDAFGAFGSVQSSVIVRSGGIERDLARAVALPRSHYRVNEKEEKGKKETEGERRK